MTHKGANGPIDSLLTLELIEHIPHAQHIHDAQRTVIQAVTRTAVARALAPEVTAMVRTDVALVAAIMIGLEDLQNAGLTVAIAVAGLREVSVLEVLDIADVRKSDAVAVLANDLSNVVVRIG